MKSQPLILIVLLLALGLVAAPQTTKKPLSKDQVMDLVKASVPSARVAELVRQNGIDFEPNEDYFRGLRSAGAEPVLIDALRAASAAKPPAEDTAAQARQHIKGANALMDTGDIDGAIALYKEAIRVSPSDSEPHRLLGIALGKKKDWQGDITEQRMAIFLNPDDAAAKAELAAALRATTEAERSVLLVEAPPDAEVYLDDEFRGRTGPKGQLKIDDLKPGAHPLRVSLPRKKVFEQAVNLTAGETSKIVAALADLPGKIVVQTTAGAEVFVDNASRGTADASGTLAVPEVPVGSYTLRITAKGKKDFQQSVTVAAGEETRIDAPLEELPPTPGMVKENPKDGLKYAWVPPGTFMMGCSPGEVKCEPEEMPRHPVRITKGFWMSQIEVPVGAYKRFVSDTKTTMPPEPNFNPGSIQHRLPIVKVTWSEARAYCSWAGGRLPTEAEWEYAARAGTPQSLYGPLDEIAWYGRNSGAGGGQWGMPRSGGLKRPNAFGLYDMLGNVFEWTNDWFDKDYYARSPQQDPPGPSSGRERVVRGRAWVAKEEDIRVSYRGSNPADGSFFEGGFRCVCDAVMP